MFVSTAPGAARSRLKRSAEGAVSRSWRRSSGSIGNGALHVEDGEIDGGRIGRLAAADVHAAAAAARSERAGHGECQRGHTRAACDGCHDRFELVRHLLHSRCTQARQASALCVDIT